MNFATGVTLALFVGGVCIGLWADTFAKSAMYACGFAVVVAIALVAWFASFFPNEGTSSQMLNWLTSTPTENAAAWILRATQKVLIAVAGTAIGYGIKRPFRRRERKA